MSLSANTVHERLQAAARQLRWSRSGRHLLLGAAVSFGAMALGLLLDAQFHFGTVGRWIGFVLIVAPWLAGMVMAARAWIVPVSEASIARRIETLCDGAQNVLISAVQFDRELPANSALRRALFAEMNDPFPRVPWKQVFDLKRIAQFGAAFGVALLVVAVWGATNPKRFQNSVARLLLPSSNIAALTQTRIAAVTPGDARVVHGGAFAVSAKLEGVVPANAWMWFREPGSSWQKAVMNREVGTSLFRYVWKGVTQPMEFYVEAGDTQSATFRVTVRSKTAVKRRSAEITLPAYAPPVDRHFRVREFNVLQDVIAGSTVAVKLEFNYPLSSLEAVDEKGNGIETEKLEDAAMWVLQFVPKSSVTFKLAYRDVDGYAENEVLQVAVKPDESPRVQVTSPPEGQQLVASRQASLNVVFECADNFALGSVGVYRMTSEARDGKLIQEWKEAAGKARFGASVKIPLAEQSGESDERVTFFVVAKDQNNLTGPGVTFSRPVTVMLRAAEQVKKDAEDAASKFQKGLDDLIKVQKTNLEESLAVRRVATMPVEVLPALLQRQMEIGELGARLAMASERLPGETRTLLRQLSQNEMKLAVLALRNATGATGEPQAKQMDQAIVMETAILTRLQGAPEAVRRDLAKAELQDLMAGLEELLRLQRELYRDTKAGGEAQAVALASRQDKLADRSRKVRDDLQKSIVRGVMADKEMNERLSKVVAMFGELKVYEDMVKATEALEGKKFADATGVQERVIESLLKMVKMLNELRAAMGEKGLEEARKTVEEIKRNAAKLIEVQKEVVAKSKEDFLKKDKLRPEDVSAAEDFKETKKLMAEAIEQMMTDAQILPELKTADELRDTLISINEEVKQEDLEAIKKNELKADEVAVQKEDGLLKMLEKLQENAEDMENWLTPKSDTAKWLLENFDKKEMPEMPLVALPDAFTDLVGDLQEEQKNMEEDAKDAASNQLLQQAPAAWDVMDGPMGSFGAQGKSGNQRPNQNEQTGRSSGGRQGESNGEMAGSVASQLEGSKVDARRTKDQQQQGKVQDEGGSTETKATGGGKAGGFGDRQGMDGKGPVRTSDGPPQKAADAKAVEQALLAQKAAKLAAQAELLYIKGGDKLAQVVPLMDEATKMLQQGRTRDFSDLHRKILAGLNEVKGQIGGSQIVALPGADKTRAADRQLAGGEEGNVPSQYRDMVADYYRALQGKE